jgi:hypothetical protein
LDIYFCVVVFSGMKRSIKPEASAKSHRRPLAS